jgi:hypothetical protein
VSVTVDPPAVNLPAELGPFAWSDYEVDRAIWKGNTNKKTFDAARFEIALREYASDQMRKDPETFALDHSWDWERTDVTREELDEYERRRQEIWERVCERPEIVQWEAELEGMY